MLTIHKFPLTIEVGDATPHVVRMPRGAKVIHVDEQYQRVAVWAEVDTDEPLEDVEFWIVGTGRDRGAMPASVQHVGSTTLFQGQLVAHVYGRRR